MKTVVKKTFIEKALNINLLTAIMVLITIAVLHMSTFLLPNSESKELRLTSDIVKNCNSGWFSSEGLCIKYQEYIKFDENDKEIPVCGEGLKNCQLQGIKDYLHYTMLIVEFFTAFYIGKIFGQLYTKNTNSKTKMKLWGIYLGWNVLILGLIFAGNKFVLFPGDIMRQVVEIFFFSMMFKMNSPKVEKKKK